MSARAWTALIATLALLGGGAGVVRLRHGRPVDASLRQVMANNFEAYNKKDINALVAGIDSRSPDYEATKNAAAEQFKTLDVNTALVDFVPMGTTTSSQWRASRRRPPASPGAVCRQHRRRDRPLPPGERSGSCGARTCSAST
jgi:hypothetical protein